MRCRCPIPARVLGAIILLLMSTMAVRASDTVSLPPEALQILRHIAIQHSGRNKPFDSFARESLQFITGEPRVRQDEPVATALSMMANPEHWQDVPLVSVPFVPLRETLGLDRRTTHVSYNALVSTRTLMQKLPAIVQKQQRSDKLSMLEQETMDAFERFSTLSGLFEQRLALVPPAHALDREWRPILQPGTDVTQPQAIAGAWTALITAVRTQAGGEITGAARRVADILAHVSPAAYPESWRLTLEVSYNRAALFRIASGLYVIACICLFLSLLWHVPWASAGGSGAIWAGYLVHGAGIIARVIIGGRPPVSNFFETMLWLPFVAMTLALVFDRVYRVRYFRLAGAILSAITLILARYVPLDSSITPVAAVLHSKLWLTIHVLTIVASYGAIALATVLAHMYGAIYLAQGRKANILPTLELFLYRTIQVGVVLLAAGIMLGAVWANVSWGRYWGWDPKETWSLITLLWFLAVFHGRTAKWLQGAGVALSTIAGFFFLLVTYYGVSFYFAGLHSYAGGHAKPLPALLVGYFIAEIVFMGAVGLRAMRHTRLASPRSR